MNGRIGILDVNRMFQGGRDANFLREEGENIAKDLMQASHAALLLRRQRMLAA